MYYTERVLPQVEEEVGRLGNLSKKERISIIQRVTRHAFENESEEIKAAVEAKLEESKSASESDDDDAAAVSQKYQRFVSIHSSPGSMTEALLLVQLMKSLATWQEYFQN